jgi:hypothetical protein
MEDLRLGNSVLMAQFNVPWGIKENCRGLQPTIARTTNEIARDGDRTDGPRGDCRLTGCCSSGVDDPHSLTDQIRLSRTTPVRIAPTGPR